MNNDRMDVNISIVALIISFSTLYLAKKHYQIIQVKVHETLLFPSPLHIYIINYSISCIKKWIARLSLALFSIKQLLKGRIEMYKEKRITPPHFVLTL